MKKAFLIPISFMTRVIVDEDLENKDNWNYLVDKVTKQVLQKIENNEIEENIEDVIEDTECPYGTIKGDMDKELIIPEGNDLIQYD